MSESVGRFSKSYARFVLVSALTAGVVVALGYFPTLRFSGPASIVSMIAGCAVSFASSCAGAIALAGADQRESKLAGQAILVSTGTRFLTVLFLVAALTFSGWFDRTVFVFWAAISYLVLLLVDSTLAVKMIKRTNENES